MSIGSALGRLVMVPNEALAAEPVEIQCNDRNLGAIADDVLEAVRRANNEQPTLFQRGTGLVRFRLNPQTGSPFLERMSVDALRGQLDRSARWIVRKWTQQRGLVDTVVPPPLEVVKDILALPGWPDSAVPMLDGIIECPAYDRHGVLVSTPGYSPDSRLWYHPTPGFQVPPVPSHPTPAQVDRAKIALLDQILRDFPFADRASRTNTLALMLLPFVRLLIDGPTPLHLIDATKPGTGKGLLVDVIHHLATGRPAVPMPEAEDNAEWRKRLLAHMLDDPRFLFIDNINTYVDSAALASALTARTLRDRVLGTSTMAEVPVNCIWVGTGNNVRMSLELVRRIPLIRLVPQLDEPWTRPVSDFRYRDLMRWVAERRGYLVSQLLTLCQAWIAASRPQGALNVGSYESWSRTMSGIMGVIGCAGLMANAPEMTRYANDDQVKWTAFVEFWWAAHCNEQVGAQQLFDLVNAEGLLEGILGDGLKDNRRLRLGRVLARKRESFFGDLQIVPAGHARNGTAQYRLMPSPGSARAAALALDTPGEVRRRRRR